MEAGARRGARLPARALPLTALVAAAVVLFAAPLRARANDLSDFEHAKDLYLHGQYTEAVQSFEQLLRGEPDPVVLQESRKYLAASYLFLGQDTAADHQVELLLRQEPTYPDPVAFPRDLQNLFHQVRQRIQREAQEAERQHQAEESRRGQQQVGRTRRERERLQRLERLAATETVEQQNSRWLALLPLGVGQFQNGDKSLGLALAVTEGVLAAVSLASFTVHALIVAGTPTDFTGTPSPDQVNRETLATGMRVTNWISTGLLALVAVGGIVDAQVRFHSVIRTSRPRALPADLRRMGSQDTDGSNVQVLLSPVSAGLRVRF